MNEHRPDARRTISVLTLGTVVAVAAFAVGFGVRYFGNLAAGDAVSTAAVMVLLATPAVALATTAIELKDVQRAGSAAAVLVLLVLAVATAIALVTR
jgi:hypothetical protein